MTLQSPFAEQVEPQEEIDLAIFKGRKVFFISDLHLGHLNIIRYCNRPFKSLEEMEEEILRKWNETVGKDDVVFFGGDLVFGRRGKPPAHYLSQLNGTIYFVKGNHDKRKDISIPVYSYLDLRLGDIRFRLVHNPDEWGHYKGWLIHGHHHNNRPEEFPIVDRGKRTINISCELLDYRPMSLWEMLWLMKDEDTPNFTREGGSYLCAVCRGKLNTWDHDKMKDITVMFCPNCHMSVGSMHRGCGGFVKVTDKGTREVLVRAQCTKCGKVIFEFTHHVSQHS